MPDSLHCDDEHCTRKRSARAGGKPPAQAARASTRVPLKLLVSRFRSVFASARVDAAIGQLEALDGPVAYNVRFDDFRNVGELHPSVPDTLGINYDGRTVLTLVEASGFISPNCAFHSTQGQFCFEGPLKFGSAGRVAATTRMSFGTLITAYEDMLCEFSHKRAGWRLNRAGFGDKKNGPHGAARRQLKPELERRLDLESPGLQKRLGNVLRVLVLSRPLA